MLEQIVRDYYNLSDSLLLEVGITNSIKNNNYQIKVLLQSMNREKNNSWEIIELIFKGVENFRIVKPTGVTNAALLKKYGTDIIVDFYPLFYNDSYLIEDLNSDFCINCKDLDFRLVTNQPIY